MAYICDPSGYCYYDNWYTWGRWVLLGGIILFVLFLCLMVHCINRRRMRGGGAPMRYTGWTAPSYGQSQQQYGYTGDPVNMGNYPQQSGQAYYGNQGPAGGAPYGYRENGDANTAGYYDATRTEAVGYQPPAYPPTAK